MKDEKLLLKNLKDGDSYAFKKLYEHYADRIYFTAIRFHLPQAEAEELVQDVFIKVWEKRKNLKEGYSFKGYLLTIARNMLINQLKRKTYETTCKQYFQKFKQHFENSTEDYVIFSDLEHHTNEFIDGMPTKRKQILLLRREKGLTSKEISEHLEIPQRTVETNIYKANRDLKKFLGSKNMNFWLFLVIPMLLTQKL